MSQSNKLEQFTSKGYIPKTQNEYYRELHDTLKSIEPQYRLEPSTPDGLKTASDAEMLANLDEAIQHCYDSRNPNAAIGYDLDIVAHLTETFRRQGTQSTVTLTLIGEVGTLVLAGSVFDSGEDTPQFKTMTEVMIPSSRSITVGAICTEKGDIEANANTITRIPIAISGVTSVTNESAATVGDPIETDEQLRVRRVQEIAKHSSGQMDSAVSAIYAVEGVRHVKSFENNTKQINDKGMEGNSTAYIVSGGDDYKVAQAIYKKRCATIATIHLGNGEQVTQSVSDEYPDNTVDINFSRPELVDVVIIITIKQDSSFPDEAVSVVRDYIIKYATGREINGKVYKPFGYKIGEIVAVSQICVPIGLALSEYGGSYIESITVNSKTEGEFVPMDYFQIANFSESNVGITLDAT